MPPKVNLELCTSCGRCAEICPLDVFRMEGGLPVVAYPDECWHCGACIMECGSRAIKVDFHIWMRPVTKRVKA